MPVERRSEDEPERRVGEPPAMPGDADEMLSGPAEGGRREVRVRGGGIFYALWGRADGAETGEVEAR